MNLTLDQLIEKLSQAQNVEDLDIMLSANVRATVDEYEKKLPIIHRHILFISNKYKLPRDNKYKVKYNEICINCCPSLFSFEALYVLREHYKKENNITNSEIIEKAIGRKLQAHYASKNNMQYKTLTEICDQILQAKDVMNLEFLMLTSLHPCPCDESLLKQALDKICYLCNIVGALISKRKYTVLFLNLIYKIYPHFSYIRLKKKRKIEESNSQSCPFLLKQNPFTTCNKSVEENEIACQDHIFFFKREYNGFSSLFQEPKKIRLDDVD